MGLIRSGASSAIERYVGYYEPYATSHDALDRDTAIQAETRNAALALLERVRGLRDGRYVPPDAALAPPRPK